MPSASTAEKSVVAPNVKCSGCGNPIIKDKQFKCLRCRPHRLVPATLDKQDIVCSRHRSAVVFMRYSQRDGYRVHCQKSGCRNHGDKVGTPVLIGEEGMTQATAGEETQTVSKTQELRDWLANEIRTAESDILVLDTALHNKTKGVTSVRYDELTSDECEKKMREDRQKLKGLKQRLEFLKSARDLDVDVDEIEKAGLEVKVVHNSRSVYIDARFEDVNMLERSFNFTLRLDSRRLAFQAGIGSNNFSSTHLIQGVKNMDTVKDSYAVTISWTYSDDEDDKLHKFNVHFPIPQYSSIMSMSINQG